MWKWDAFGTAARGAAILVLFGAAGCASQRSSADPSGQGGMIRGRVVSPEGQGIPGVQVTTDPPTDIRITGPDGTFEIARVAGNLPVPPNTYRLYLDKLGYQKPERPTEILFDGADLDIGDLELRERGGAEVRDTGAIPTTINEGRPGGDPSIGRDE